MNNCTIAVNIIDTPQCRHTYNDKAVTECWGEFYSPHHNEKSTLPPASKIKIVAWGEIAKQLNNLKVTQQCIIQGRLQMNTIEKPEGYKEKRAELTAERIFLIDAILA